MRLYHWSFFLFTMPKIHKFFLMLQKRTYIMILYWSLYSEIQQFTYSLMSIITLILIT